jgi:hypothetical protein
MLWVTKNNGNFRVVRLTRRFAFKTPRLLEFRGLNGEWKQQCGHSASKPTIGWLWRTWLELFRQNRLVNEEEVRTYKEWQRRGSQRAYGVGLCPILFHLPWGFLNVMPRAAPVPLDRVNRSHDPFSNGAVSSEEMNAAGFLMGRNLDTSKVDTFGLVNGELVVVDYGWVPPHKVSGAKK